MDKVSRRGRLTHIRQAYTVTDMNPLAQMMRDAGHTQATIAEALGVTQATVSRKVAGKSGWSVLEITELSRLLDVTRAEVLAAVTDDMDGAA